jgi:hypothetical protein
VSGFALREGRRASKLAAENMPKVRVALRRLLRVISRVSRDRFWTTATRGAWDRLVRDREVRFFSAATLKVRRT